MPQTAQSTGNMWRRYEETADQNKMQFGRQTRVGFRNHMLVAGAH